MARSKRSRKQAKGKPWHEPTDREKCQKIDQAITALESGNASIIADKHLDKAYKFLGIEPATPKSSRLQDRQESEAEATSQLYDYVIEFLEEIKASGPAKCFFGNKAKRCLEPGYEHLFLFPYKIKSKHFKEVVYLKFGIDKFETSSGKTYYYCHCTLHEDEPNKGA